ncbi:NifB/NifX family molybdenum-iron cluster-binding protein [Azospirillum sp. sgz301742]
MRVAVATRDYQTVTGHAGQARHWLVYDATPDRAPTLVSQVELTREQSFHHWRDNGPHPLDGIVAVIANSAGEGFLKRMEKRGIAAIMTGESEPAKAVADWFADTVTPPKPRPIGKLLCKVRDLFSEHR